MTVFNNKILTPPLRGLSRIFLGIFGWTCENQKPDTNKYVAVMAPHTSNWDFLYFIAAALIFRLDVRWLGKHTLFKGPMGPIMRWFGGVSVKRREAGDIVTDAAHFLRGNQTAAVAIAPEGTRSKVKRWKTGFYRIAVESDVPILLTYLDYPTKTAGLGPLIKPTGDQEADIAKIQAFYQAYQGKNPNEQFA
jgi:1-acyl-sn-glycerol-3-phosphate acyltransferase